jgi:hypothetical protein
VTAVDTGAYGSSLVGLARGARDDRLEPPNRKTLDVINRAIADFLWLPFLRRWAYKPWWYAYNRVALALAGVMWAAGGAAILILSLFFRVYS